MGEILDKEINVYASNVQEKPIHISEAESGRKGYFCLGCKKEMQAVKAKKEKRMSYFRHDPKDVDPKHKRLGIDTIQVTISKGSPEEIEASLMKTDRIKWIYN
ncbi:MAG: hypothetical protein EOO43_15300, partial [Flavobacterium sp.]